MTGCELIELIRRYNAEDKQVIVQYRDSGGNYSVGQSIDRIYFARASYPDPRYGFDYDIRYCPENDESCNAIVL